MDMGDDAVNNGAKRMRPARSGTYRYNYGSTACCRCWIPRLNTGEWTDEPTHTHEDWLTGETGMTTFQLQTTNGGLNIKAYNTWIQARVGAPHLLHYAFFEHRR